MTLKVFLVDDEPLARRRLTLMLRELPDLTVVGESDGGEEALANIAALKPHVLLLDINMPGLDGFELSGMLQGPSPPAIIFVTAFKHHALRAWEEEDASAYLLKPVSFKRLGAALARARTQLRARDAEERVAELTGILRTLRAEPPAASPYDTEFWAQRHGALVRLKTARITWVEAERDYVRLHATDGSMLLRETITNMLTRLDPEIFVRIHRSSIVRLADIEAVQQGVNGALRVVLASGVTRPVGRTYASHLRAIMRSRMGEPWKLGWAAKAPSGLTR